jgi:uncharacterized membrane protein YhhN
MKELTGLILMAVLGTYYFCRKKTDRKRALFCKAAATSVPGILLAVSMIEGNVQNVSAGGNGTGFTVAVGATLAAIVFYMAADVLLECRFILGAVCFSIGHVWMAAGFFLSREAALYSDGHIDAGFLLSAGAAFVVFIAAAVAALHRYFHQLKQKKLFCPMLGYIAVLGIMASLAAASGIRTGGAPGAAAAAGGICFAVSDILLGRNRLGKRRSRVRGAAVLILYYLSVYLFALRFWI